MGVAFTSLGGLVSASLPAYRHRAASAWGCSDLAIGSKQAVRIYLNLEHLDH